MLVYIDSVNTPSVSVSSIVDTSGISSCSVSDTIVCSTTSTGCSTFSWEESKEPGSVGVSVIDSVTSSWPTEGVSTWFFFSVKP